MANEHKLTLVFGMVANGTQRIGFLSGFVLLKATAVKTS